MTIEVSGSTAVLSGVCTVEEALDLHEFLRATSAPAIDLKDCTYLHTALLQLLITARAKITQAPQHAVLNRWLMPLLSNSDARWIVAAPLMHEE